ncbi:MULTISPECIES: gluconate 2-dehydrogenase subunit 3 family protein [Croceitalea]|uniref:Gluconate 2-dehydrogenase subunit 3 family protein n=1 Tax=Croceitalea vernalis TaxID=3075599 RepID=A0ABU3BEU0_9FLAO|nr:MULTISPECIES: gluconate 2-dehydrogenase subunit 3 family protein [unclassified Croceitalea]MDT0538898.1 gluconate 2-dehydrogenase subunit 3 family protein [Croceitalea sp. P059]MDT0620685.1 gluconate 2-dehydrogenase subunit 3 family protein [Croceitalea sp. P007]
MERRSALKNIGMVFGYAVATPTIISLAQSCKEKMPYAEWIPSFFEKDKGYALAQMIDVILPRTDTPSATDVNVHVFIDEFAKSVLPEEQQGFMTMVMDTFMNKVLTGAGKESLADIEGIDFEPLLGKYLAKRSDEDEEAQEEMIGEYMEAMMKGESAELDEEVACFTFATNVRDMATWGYKSSEYVGEEVLAYLPVPGEYIACGDLDELSGGKAWSL